MTERERPVRVLSPDVARKIAAGEVVDRPAALARELIDNAIDAGAGTVELSVEGGGIRRTEVHDDGAGMTREDLELCWLAHATSKITSAEDLESAETLGFRGEALAAAAAVARLEIVSSRDGREAWRLAVGPGAAAPSVERAGRARGTSVRALGLFDALPARKRFLKREGAEALLCRQALLDKALAFPHLNFRFLQDGALKLFLPAVGTYRERFASALLEDAEAGFLHEIGASGSGFTVSIVIGGPELRRNDRRLQYVFANGRRIQDFSLLQALEYGVQGWFPAASHPVAAVYVDIDPALADFNIHPAKREVRFRDPGAIHHAVSSSLRDFMRHRGVAAADPGRNPVVPGQARAGEFAYPVSGPSGVSGQMAMEALLDQPPDFAPRPGRNPPTDPPPVPADGDDAPIRYIGRLFELFILVERGATLYIIDQHAAHERILFDRLRGAPIPRQELLVPLSFRTDSAADDDFLAAYREDLASLGVQVERDGERGWRIDALPAAWRTDDGETVSAILELRGAGENLAERWLATMACHSAVRDGDPLDSEAALNLARAALALPVPRCPHGRPVWSELSRDDLLRAVRRIE